MTYDPLLYGKSPIENIVACHPTWDYDEATIRYYIREGKYLIHEDVQWFPYAWISDPRIVSGLKNVKIHPLKGSLHYNYLVYTDTYTDFKKIKTRINDVNTDYPHSGTYISNYTQSWLVQSGNTQFKGMGFEETVRMQVDIEAYGKNGSFTRAENPEHPITIMVMRDNRGNKKIIHWAHSCQNMGDDFYYVRNEYELLVEFIDTFLEWDPDVIEMHNGFGYDWPYIIKRAELHDIKLPLGRDGSEPWGYKSEFRYAEQTRSFTTCQINGRHVVDTMFAAMSYDVYKRELPSYGLKPCAKYFGFAKEDRTYIPGDEIWWYWDNKPEELLRYAMDDGDETEALATQLMGSAFYTAPFIPMSYEDIGRKGSGSKIESMFMREYLRQRHSIPKPMRGKQQRGGHTKMHIQGLIGPIVYADVESMYPAIMLNFEGTTPRSDELKIFRPILQGLTDLRFDWKGEMKTAKKEGDKEREQLYDGQQAACKILINSHYGILSFAFAHWNDFKAGERVAEIGREIVQNMNKYITENQGKVIECDSVVEYTPVYIRRNREVDIVSIKTLHDSNEKRRFDHGNTEVLTRNGWTKINYTKRHKTDKKILEVKTVEGTIVVTEDHSLFNSEGKEIRPGDLNIGDTIEVKSLGELPERNYGGNYEHGWLLGAMVSDGSASRVKRKYGGWSTNVSCAKKDKIFLERVQELALKYYGTKMKLYNTEESSGCSKLIGGYNKDQYELWFEMLYDPTTREKKVPKTVLNGDEDIKEGFIQGCIDGDGYRQPNGRITFTSKSHVLMAGVWWILKDIGMADRINVEIRPDKETIVGLTTCVGDRWYKYDDNEVRKILERKYTEDVYDISTEDRTFVAGVGGIVAHNTDGVIFVPPEHVVGEDAEVDFVLAMNETMPEGIKIGFDGRGRQMLSYKAKNYILEDYDGKRKIKGGAFKSRGLEPYNKEFLEKGFFAIMDGGIQGLSDMYHKYREDISNRTMHIDMLKSSSGLTKSFDEYEKDVKDPSKNVYRKSSYEVGKILRDKYGEDVGKGDKVEYYISGTTKDYKDKSSFLLAKPVREFDNDYCIAHYLYRLDKTMERFEPLFSPSDFHGIFTKQTDLFPVDLKEVKPITKEVE